MSTISKHTIPLTKISFTYHMDIFSRFMYVKGQDEEIIDKPIYTAETSGKMTLTSPFNKKDDDKVIK